MIDKIVGFLWGLVVASISFDFISDDINIHGWIWVLLVLFVLIISAIFEIYSFITDYKAMAETGWSFGKKLYMWASKKWITKKD